jgi:hypothetical protein
VCGQGMIGVCMDECLEPIPSTEATERLCSGKTGASSPLT